METLKTNDRNGTRGEREAKSK